MSKSGKVKRQFHPRARRAARATTEDTVSRGTAAIFITAAVRLLEREHAWGRAEAVAFGDRLAVAAGELANEVLSTTGPAGRGRGRATAELPDDSGDDAAEPEAGE